jgi:hypothetical protein
VIRRAPAVAAAVAAAAFALAGCGGDDFDSPLDEALGYLPEDAPFVLVLETDPDGPQLEQIDELIEKFPFADQLRAGFDSGFSRRSGIDFGDDLAPQAGNEVVLGRPDAGAAETAVLAWKVEDPDKARKFLDREGKKVDGPAGDAFEVGDDEDVATLDGDFLVLAPSRDLLDKALDRHDSDGHLSEDRFEDRLGALDREALIRVVGDLESLSDLVPPAAKRAAPWLGTVRDIAAVAYAKKDGLAIDSTLRTEGATAEQLPIAPGSAAPPVTRRKGEIAVGMREPVRLFAFLDSLGSSTPAGPGLSTQVTDYESFKAALERIGIDLRRDVLDHLAATAAASFALDGTFAARADLNDPAGVEDALETIAERLPAELGRQAAGFRIEPAGDGFYRVTGSDGSDFFVGVVGDRVVLGSDADRARDFAGEDAEPVPGARGAIAVHANVEDVVNTVVSKRAGGLGALFGRAFTEPLGDFTGWTQAEPDGITSHLELKIQ